MNNVIKSVLTIGGIILGICFLCLLLPGGATIFGIIADSFVAGLVIYMMFRLLFNRF